MSTLKEILALAAFGALAFGATPTLAETPRTTAGLVAVVGESEEPLPPSPGADTREAVTGGLGIGSPATPGEIAVIDIDIMPDGTGLPEGRGSFAAGKALYEERCAVCHGDNLQGVAEVGGPVLIGGAGSLTTDKPLKTVESYWPYASTLYDYIRRTMPLPEPGSLSNDEVYALSAYILGRAGIVGEDAVLDATSFREIRMPNADNFIPDPRPAAH